MKITKSQLKQIIKEEMENTLQESSGLDSLEGSLNRNGLAMRTIQDLHEVVNRIVQKAGYQSRGLSRIPFMVKEDEHGYISVMLQIPLKQVKQKVDPDEVPTRPGSGR